MYNDAVSFVKTGQQKTYDLLNKGVDTAGDLGMEGLQTFEDVTSTLMLHLLVVGGAALIYLSRK